MDGLVPTAEPFNIWNQRSVPRALCLTRTTIPPLLHKICSQCGQRLHPPSKQKTMLRPFSLQLATWRILSVQICRGVDVLMKLSSASVRSSNGSHHSHQEQFQPTRRIRELDGRFSGPTLPYVGLNCGYSLNKTSPRRVAPRSQLPVCLICKQASSSLPRTKELRENFSSLYKHSNRGFKGRSKHRWIAIEGEAMSDMQKKQEGQDRWARGPCMSGDARYHEEQFSRYPCR